MKLRFNLISKYFILVFCITSCNKNFKEIHITDFSKPVEDSLSIKNIKKNFTTYRVEVEGNSSDTCLIYLFDRNFGSKLVGIIDTAFITDYYGGFNPQFNFEPYKATEGELKVTLIAL